MKFRLWHLLGITLLFGFANVAMLGCSGSQQQQQEDQLEAQQDEDQDQQDQDQQDQDQQDQDQYADAEGEENLEGYQGNEENNLEEGGEEAMAGEEQQGDLQEIIEDMNEEGGNAAGGEAYAEGNAEGGQAYAEGTEANAAAAEANAAAGAEGENLGGEVPVNADEAATGVSEAETSAGMAAAPGLPELGSKMSYVVQRGDSLATIAMKVYGDMNKWREIADFTGMANPRLIYPGDVVYYQLTENTMAFAAAYETAPRSEVTVGQGDTLSTIAGRVLGDSQAWKSIWRENDQIDNPDELTAGMTIYYVDSGAMMAEIAKWKHQLAAVPVNKVRQATTIRTSGKLSAQMMLKSLNKKTVAVQQKKIARVI